MNPTPTPLQAAPKAKKSSPFFERLARGRFFSFSLFFHTVLIIILSGIILIPRLTDTDAFTAGDHGGLMGEEGDPGSEEESDPEMAKPDEAEVNNNAVEFDPLTTTGLNPTFAVNIPTKISPDVRMSAGGSIGDGMGGGGGGGGGNARVGKSVNIFKTNAKGVNFLFVVDVSSSMIYGSREKSVKTYEELEREVGRVIRTLDEKNRFGIVVFSKDAMVFNEQLVTATTDARTKALEWLKKQSPAVLESKLISKEVSDFHHGTRADLALARAFKYKPDTIFFISDGEPSGTSAEKVIEAVEEAQKGLKPTAAIHTIAYLADGGQKFMKELAEKNQGSFREINPKDLR